MPAAKTKPKDRLKWLIDRGHIPADFEGLGERILLLSEKKASEPSPHMHFDSGAGGGMGSGGALQRVSARQKWERMFATVGPIGEAVICAVIIDGMTKDEAAEALNLHPKAITPMLRLALDVIGRAT